MAVTTLRVLGLSAILEHSLATLASRVALAGCGYQELDIQLMRLVFECDILFDFNSF